MKFIKASLCLSVALALGACSENISVETHLENAKSYLNKNQVNESIIELKNAIRADTKNAEARYLLGQLYLNLGDSATAVKELERANELKFDGNKVIPSLARAYILSDSDLEVILLSESSEKLSANARLNYLAYKALAELRTDKAEKAEGTLNLAKSIDDKNAYTLLAQAYLSFSKAEFEQALVLIADVLVLLPQQVDTLLLQGQVAMQTQQYEQAVTSFKAFASMQPRFGLVNILLADALLKSGQDAEAEKYADAILSQVPTQPFAHYIKAMVAFNKKDFDKASEHAELALSANFNQMNLTLVAGASAFYLSNWQQSHHHLSTVVDYLPQDHQARRMLAVTQLELGLIDEIGDTVEGFDTGNEGDNQFLSVMSYRLLELGATDEAKKLLAETEEHSKNNAGDLARQGIIKLMMNDPSGIQDLEDAVAIDPEFIGAELALAYAAIQKNDLEKARLIANKWQAKDPNKAGGYTLLASIAIAEKKYDEAESLLAKSLSLAPGNLFALTEQLRLAREQKDIPLSKERVDFLIQATPDNDKVLRHYFGIYQNEMALDKLQEAYQANKGDIKKALLVAEAMMSLSQFKEAEALLISLEDEVKLPKRYWQLVIVNYKKQNQLEKIQPTLEKWLKANPYHLEPISLLADFYVGKGDNKRALNVIKRGLEYHEDNISLQLIQMQLLLNDKQVFPAKKLYKKLAVTNIDGALKHGIEGRILFLEEEYEKSLPKLVTLYEAYPSSQNAIYIARAHLANKNELKAVEVLEHHLTKDGSAHEIKTLLAGMYLKNDTLKAIGVYEDVVQNQPQNVIAHNNLAWLYLENNNIEKSLLHAKKAFDLAPGIANVVDTYSKALFASGDNRTALKYAREAVDLSKGQDIEIQLNYAEVLIANSRSNEAADLLNKIVTSTELQKNKKQHLLSQL